MDKIQMELFEQLTGLHQIPEGAYNIRANSQKDSRNTTANIDIVTKEAENKIIFPWYLNYSATKKTG